MSATLGSAAFAFTVTLTVAPPVLALLRRRALLDHPNDRSSHHSPTPRGLGLAPAIGALVAMAAIPVLHGPPRTGLLVAAAGFGILGLVEDVAGVPPLPRLAAQLGIAAVSLWWLLDGLTSSGPTAWHILFAGGCALWLVAYVNAFNFMDGINGISAAQVLVAATAWWAIGHVENVPALSGPALVVGAATLAFTPFNFPNARAFLGDVGSYFLGAWLAVAVIIGLRSGLAPEAVIAPLGLYLADTAATIVRRVRDKEAWYLPHRSHAYQRLTQLGWSHARTTLAVAATMATTAAVGALSLTGSLPLRVAGDAALAAVLAGYLLIPHGLPGAAAPAPRWSWTLTPLPAELAMRRPAPRIGTPAGASARGPEAAGSSRRGSPDHPNPEPVGPTPEPIGGPTPAAPTKSAAARAGLLPALRSRASAAIPGTRSSRQTAALGDQNRW